MNNFTLLNTVKNRRFSFTNLLQTLVVIVMFGLSQIGFGQVNVTTLPQTYTQDFNTLSSTAQTAWTDNTTATLPNWYISPAATQLAISTGTTTGGQVLNLGIAGVNALTDRALGCLQSGGTAQYFGLRLKNNSATAIASFTINFNGEQWRQNNAANLLFHYQVGTTVTSLTAGTWTAATPFNFAALKTGTAGPLDGNDSTNRTNISNTLTVTVPAGSEIMFRWSRNTNSSPILAVDDLSITANAASTNPVLGISGTTSHGSVCPNTAATSITYTISNTGASQADGVAVSSNDAQFVVSGLSATSIPASGTATYNVTFTPSSAGAKSATITVSSTTSGSNSPTSSLSGTGTATTSGAVTSTAATLVTAKTATINGNVTSIGACPQITEKGFVYSETSVNATPVVLGTGVTKQSVAGIATGTFNLALSNLPSSTQYSFRAYVYDGTTYVYGSVLTFTTSPALVLSGTLAHGSVCPTLSATAITYTITNNGATAANNIAVVSSNPEFVVSALSSTTIAPSGTATYQVTFTPLSAGAKTSDITVSSTTAASVTNSLSGTGTAFTAQSVGTNIANNIITTGARLRANTVVFGTCPNTTVKGFVYSLTASNNDPLIGGASVVDVPVTPLGTAGNYTFDVSSLPSGTNYSYKAYLFDGTSYVYGGVQTFTTLAPPANDNCAGAISITTNAVAISGDLANASQSIPAISCGTFTGTADDDVWYKFTTTSAGNYTIAADGGTNIDFVLDLRDGACDGVNIGCADATTSGVETVTVSLVAATTYFVRLYSYGSTIPTTTSFTVSVTTVPVLSNNGTANLTFGNQDVLTNSTSQTVAVSGQFLTGFPGVITVVSPSTDFQVSTDNATWNPSVTLPYSTDVLASTTVYVRFSPQSTGSKTGNLSISGGGATAVTVALNGTGAFATPVAIAASDILQNSFTANWNAVTGATNYSLDVATSSDFVSTTVTDVVSWNFPNNPDDAVADSGIATNLAKTIVVGGGVNTLVFTAGGASTNSANAVNWQNGNGSKYWEVNFSTQDYYGIKVSSKQRGSGTAPRDFKLQYKIGSGGTYTDVAGSAITVANNYTSGVLSGLSLPSVCDNQPSVYLRWVMASNTNINGVAVTAAGSANIDDIKIEGNLGNFVPGYANLTVAGTSQSVTGLTQSTTYYYRVRANDANTSSQNSNMITVTTKPVSVTWDGTAWSNTTGPDADIEAAISGVYNTGTNSGFTAKKVTVTSTPAGSLTIAAGTNVTVVNEVVNQLTETAFVVKSDGNLIQTNDVTNTGAITVERLSAPIARLDYTLWSSPVDGQQLQAFSPGTVATRFYSFNPTLTPQGGSAGQGAFETITSTNPFVEGNGYLIRASNWQPTTATPWLGIFKGVPNNGNVSISTTSGSWYAIGNPYPSTIDADEFINANSLTQPLYFWRKVNASANPSYATYTLVGQTGVGNPNTAGGSTITPDGIIAAGQGFLTQATSSSLVFTNALRNGDFSTQFLRTASNNRSRVWLNLSNNEGFVNQMLVGYMATATTGIDAAMDGRFLELNTQTQLSSIINGEEFAVQGRPAFTASDVVAIGFKTQTEGNYTIAIDHVDGLFADGQEVFLKDNLINTVHNLTNAPYNFVATAGTANTRFEIVYESTLATQNPVLNENMVIIYKQNQNLVVNTGAIQMKDVKVYDIQGRLLVEQNNVNAATAKLAISSTNQVLIVKVTSKEGTIVTKKVVF